MGYETEETRGLSYREILLEVRADLKDLREERFLHDKREAEDFGKRPTRAELYSALGMAVMMATLIIGLFSMVAS